MNLQLKLALLESGEPAYRVAARAALGESTLSRIVRGRRLPTAEEMRRIARALHVPEGRIFGSGNGLGSESSPSGER